MKIFKGMFVLVAICAIHNIAAVDMLAGAPVPSIQGANYQRFSKEYKGYLIDQNNQIDINWVRGALAALQNDGLYNPNNFLNILWADIESLANYYAQGNYAFKEATRQSLIRAFNHVGGTFQVPQPVASPWESRQVLPPRSLPQVPQAQPAQQAQQAPRVTPPAVSFSIRTIMDGVLGSAYASKVNEIYSYNDTLALKRGDHSLKGKLSMAITSANANSSAQGKVTQLKAAIDSIYNDLQAYRGKDAAQMSQQAASRALPQVPQVQRTPQGSGTQRSSVDNNVADFIEDSKRRGIVGVNDITQAWLTEATGAVLNGMPLTEVNKSFIQQKLMDIADAVVAVPSWDMSKDEYPQTVKTIEAKIKNFMNTLQVGTRYSR